MKTLFLILSIVLCSCVKSQIPDNVKHHYAGVAISAGTGYFMYKVTKGKRFVSVATGLATGIFAGIAKEEIYDRVCKKGTPTEIDKLNTAWGAFCGSVYLSVGLHIHNRKLIDTTRYKNL